MAWCCGGAEGMPAAWNATACRGGWDVGIVEMKKRKHGAWTLEEEVLLRQAKGKKAKAC